MTFILHSASISQILEPCSQGLISSLHTIILHDPSTLPPSNVVLESMKAYWHECHKLKTTLLLLDSIFEKTCLHMNSIKNKGRRGSSALPLFIHKIVWHRNYSLFDKSPQYSSDLEHWSKSNIKITEGK